MEGNLSKISDVLAKSAGKYKRRPRYTVVLHDVREKMGEISCCDGATSEW